MLNGRQRWEVTKYKNNPEGNKENGANVVEETEGVSNVDMTEKRHS